MKTFAKFMVLWNTLLTLLMPTFKIVVAVLILVALYAIAGDLSALAGDVHGSLYHGLFHVLTN